MYDWDDNEFEMNNDEFDRDPNEFLGEICGEIVKKMQDFTQEYANAFGITAETLEKYDINFSQGNKKVLKDYTFLIPDNFVTELYEGKDLYAYLPSEYGESILISHVNTFGGDENDDISELIKTKPKDSLITIMNNTNVVGGDIHYIETQHATGGFCIFDCHAMLHMMTKSSCVIYRISFIDNYDERDRIEMIKEIAEGFIPTIPYKGSNIKKYMPEDKYFLEGKISEGLVEEWIQALHDKNDEEALVYMKKISPIQNDIKCGKLTASDFKSVGQKEVDEYASVSEEILKKAVDFLNSARNQNCSQKIIDKICAHIDAFYEAHKTIRLSFDDKIIIVNNVKCPSFCRSASDDVIYGGEYAEAVKLMKSAKNKKQYENAAKAFDKINMYKDSDELAAECRRKATESEDLKARFNTLIKQLAVLNESEGCRDELLDDLNVTNKMLNDAIGLKQRFPELTDKINQAKDNIAALNNKIKALNEEREHLTIFSFKKRKEINLKDEEFVQKMTELKNILKHFEDECGDYSSISELDNDISTYKKDIENIKEYINIVDTCNKKSILSEIKKIGIKEELLPIYCALYDGSYSVKLGKLPQFKEVSEDINWIILDRRGSRMLVISEYVLDASPMVSYGGYSWEKCNIRKYLNDSFYRKVFSEDEKQLISTVTVPTSHNSGPATQDKLFLLSIDEAMTYFSCDYDRKCEYTDYSSNNGAFMYAYGSRSTAWWLRSRSEFPVSCVDNEGIIREHGHQFYMSYSNMPDNYPETCGIRPAMWLDLSL